MTNPYPASESADRPDYPVDPARRQPSPSAQHRYGDLWRVRIGLVVITTVCIASAALASRLIHA